MTLGGGVGTKGTVILKNMLNFKLKNTLYFMIKAISKINVKLEGYYIIKANSKTNVKFEGKSKPNVLH